MYRSFERLMRDLAQQPQATLFAVHVCRFSSRLELLRWRRLSGRRLTDLSGCIFARPMTFIGSRSSGGFGGPLPPYLEGLVLFSAWRSSASFAAFLDLPVGRTISDPPRSDWWVLSEVISTRGSHCGARPLSPAPTSGSDIPFATFTLGRSHPHRLGRFLWQGLRLGPYIARAPGLIAAASAGSPLSGNSTFSLWESEEDMLRFAYQHADGHLKTARAEPPILREQLNARLRPIRMGGSLDWPVGDSQRRREVAADLA